jgi:hypothetical protein
MGAFRGVKKVRGAGLHEKREGKGGKTEFKTEFHTQGGGNTKLTENLTTPTNAKTNKLD